MATKLIGTEGWEVGFSTHFATVPRKLPPRPRRILLVHHGSVEGMLYAMPAIRSVRTAYPDSEMHLWCSAAAAELWLGEPTLNHIWTAGPPNREHYHLQVDLLPNASSLWRRIRQGTPYLTRGTIRAAHVGERMHELEINRLTVFALMPAYLRSLPPSLVLPREAVNTAHEIQRRFQLEQYALLHPAASLGELRWPADRYAELAEHLHNEHGLQILLLGSEADSGLLSDISSRSNVPTISLPGQCSLLEFAALAQQARLTVGPFHATLHVAAAVGCPVVMLTTEVVPPGIFDPVAAQVRLQRAIGPHVQAVGTAALAAAAADLLQPAVEQPRQHRPAA